MSVLRALLRIPTYIIVFLLLMVVFAVGVVYMFVLLGKVVAVCLVVFVFFVICGIIVRYGL